MSANGYAHLSNRLYGGNKWGDQLESFYGNAIDQKASFDSSTAGINNDVYGAALWNIVNMQTNLYGALPKIDATSANTSIDSPRPRTFRVAHNPPTVSDVGEGGSVPTAQVYDVKEVAATAKRDPIVFEATVLQEIYSQISDGVPFDDLKALGEDFLQRSIERDALAAPVASGGTQYSAENNITSIDRVVASGDEEANAQDSSDVGYTAGDLDVYDIDRSADSWGDAYVDHNGAGGDRQLTASLIDDFISNLCQNGSARRENLVIFTGYDTASVMNDLVEDRGRYMMTDSASRESVGDNGETRPGISMNRQFRDWDGIPIVQVESMPGDTLSRIFALDFTNKVGPNGENLGPKIGIEQYMAPYVEQSGQNQAQGFLSTGEFKNKALYLMYHELVCRDFSAQGKLRDLSQ